MKDDGDFGKELTMLRNRANLKQRDLANKMGVSEKTIQNWENGLRPGAKNLQKLIALYVRLDIFDQGRELEEARELWNKAGLNVAFDKTWFQQVLSDKLNKEASASSLEQAREKLLQPSETS